VEPVDANAGHLDRPPTVFPTVTAQVEGHFDLVRGRGEGVFVLADVDLPMAVDCDHFPTGTGYLANDLFLMQTRILPGLKNEPYASALTHGWMHSLPTNY